MAAKPSRDMKKSQRDPVYKIDEFEDLTLFANESFDTEDVDLFEFSSEESSPLMRLKSIILSLDWEINDDILQELADELENLQSLWQGDKVAEVYLQGLSKIGDYIRSKGAYAHPNSIKLLLTFFSNFEKIISSQNITGEEITQLLTGDVRKFRILQFQIKQNEAETAPDFDEKSAETAARQIPSAGEGDDAKQLKAAILSLDWEVTDESLKQFNSTLALFFQKYSTDRPALVLVQGLQALGDYISEERAEAHPEAFILLHSFNEALEQMAEQSLDQDTIQDLLVDRINRLNNLKMLIVAQTTSPLDEKLINGVVEEISAPGVMDDVVQPTEVKGDEGMPSPAFLSADAAITETSERQDALSTDSLEAEIDTLFAMDVKPAMETADVQYPDEILPLEAIHPVDDEVAGDFMEAHLNINRGLMPALSDADEVSGYNEDAEPLDLPTQSDLAEQLDFLFNDTVNEDAEPSVTLSALESSALEMAIDDEEQPVAALADVNPEEEEPLELLALSDAEAPTESPDFRREDSETDQDTLDIQSKLDTFFADAVEHPVEPEKTDRPSVEEIEQSLFFNEETGIESALADSEEERGFSEEEAAAAFDYTPMEEIEEKLDFFFGTDTTEEPPAMTERETEPAAEISWLEEEEKPSGSTGIPEQSLDLVFEETPEEATIAPALSEFALPDAADKKEELSFADDEVLDVELEGALDFFFDANEDDEEDADQTTVDELTQTLEASIDAGPAIAADVGWNEQAAALTPEESRQIQLAALGALLPGTVRTLSREKVAESTQLIATLQNTGLPSGPQALLQLLNSVISLLVRLPKKDDAATEKLVNFLYQHLLDGQDRPEILPEAVTRFTAWLQDASAIMPLVPTETGQAIEPHFEYTAKELYFELSELRAHIREEFTKLRHEMHHQ